MAEDRAAPLLTLDEDSGAPKVVLRGPWRDEYVALFEGGDHTALELNGEKGFVGDDLDFLAQLPSLAELEVVAPLSDDSGVEHCTGLRVLRLQTGCRGSIDFSGMRSLRRAFLGHLRGRESVLGCTSLESLYAYDYPYEDLSPLSRLTSLQRLDVGPARKLTSLAGLEAVAGGLRSLGVYAAPKLERLEALSAAAGLTELQFYGCRKLRDLSPLAALVALQRLLLVDCGTIASLRPLAGLDRLETLLFYGSTSVSDGDLQLLEGLPRLKDLAFADRRHYNRRSADFPACQGA